MKVFIWLFCFFVVAVIQTAAREVGVILGAIPAMLLFGLAWWSAKKLCARWDQRQAQKAALVASVAPDPVPLPAEPSPTIADPAAPAPTTPKLRFCKHCGSPIEPATRKCTGCGKQYFRPPVLQKKHLAIAAGVLACAALIILIFSLTSQLNAANAQIAELENQIVELELTIHKHESSLEAHERSADYYVKQIKEKNDRINELNSTIKTLQDTAQKIIPENFFYSQHIVLIGEGNKYHKYDCAYLDMSDGFLAYNTENAKAQGYKPCSHCCD